MEFLATAVPKYKIPVEITHCHCVATSLATDHLSAIVFDQSFRLAKSIDCFYTYILYTYYTYDIIIIIIITYKNTKVTVSYYIIFIRGLMGPSKSLFRFIISFFGLFYVYRVFIRCNLTIRSPIRFNNY